MSTVILASIQTEFTRYSNIILLIMGFIGNIFIIIIFGRHHNKSCSMYLVWASIASNLLLIFVIPGNLYSLTYGELSSRSIIFCKLRQYLSHTIAQTSRYYLVLACFDRFIITTMHSYAQFITRISTAKYLLVITCVIWHIIPVHMLIFINVNNGRCSLVGLYYILYYTYVLIFSCFIPSILMSIFGYLTYRNMKHLHTRIQPMTHSPNRMHIRKRDRELLKMVLGEVVVSLVTLFPYPFIILETAITTYIGTNKTIGHMRIESFLIAITSMLHLLSSASHFYIFFTISKPFRNDVHEFIITIRHRIMRPNQLTTQ